MTLAPLIENLLIALEYILIFKEQGCRKSNPYASICNGSEQLMGFPTGRIKPSIENIGVEDDARWCVRQENAPFSKSRRWRDGGMCKARC
jgi:hypothetical protein